MVCKQNLNTGRLKNIVEHVFIDFHFVIPSLPTTTSPAVVHFQSTGLSLTRVSKMTFFTTVNICHWLYLPLTEYIYQWLYLPLIIFATDNICLWLCLLLTIFGGWLHISTAGALLHYWWGSSSETPTNMKLIICQIRKIHITNSMEPCQAQNLKFILEQQEHYCITALCGFSLCIIWEWWDSRLGKHESREDTYIIYTYIM